MLRLTKKNKYTLNIEMEVHMNIQTILLSVLFVVLIVGVILLKNERKEAEIKELKEEFRRSMEAKKFEEDPAVTMNRNIKESLEKQVDLDKTLVVGNRKELVDDDMISSIIRQETMKIQINEEDDYYYDK